MLGALQIGAGDILSAILGNPFALSLTLLVVSGYVFVALTARRTALWGSQTTGTERTLITIGLAAGFELFAYFSFFALAETLYPNEVNPTSIYYMSVVTTVATLVVPPLILWANRETVSEPTARKTYAVFLQLLALLELSISVGLLVMLSSTFFRPAETRELLSSVYFNDLVYWFVAFAFSYSLWYIYTGLYYAKLPNYTLGEVFKSPSGFSVRVEKFAARYISIRKASAAVLLPLVVAGCFVYADNSFSIVSPSVTIQSYPYSFSDASNAQNPTYEIGLSSNNSVQFGKVEMCTPLVYQEFLESVTIRVPYSFSFSLENITLTNPSSVSTVLSPLTNSNYLTIIDGPVWEGLFISIPEQLQVTSVPSKSSAAVLEVGLDAASHPSTQQIELAYVEPSDGSVISCKESNTRIYDQNGTETVRHSFGLVNLSNQPAQLAMLRVNDLLAFNANMSTFRIYRNDTLFNGYYRINNAAIYCDYFVLPPHHSENYTVAFNGLL